MVSFITETPDGQQVLPPDKWFEEQMLIIKTTKTHLQKESSGHFATPSRDSDRHATAGAYDGRYGLVIWERCP